MKRTTVKWIIVAVLVVIVAAGLTWRLVPRPLSGVMDADTERVTSMAVAAMVPGLENGLPKQYVESMSGEEDPALIREVMEILDSVGYRPDFRNLLPWPQSGTVIQESGGTAVVMLVWGQEPGESCSIVCYGSGLATVSSGAGDGVLRYHLTDRELVSRLEEFLRLNGEAG